MTIKVIYHANCPDGFCSAYLFNKHFTEEPGEWAQDTMEFIPMHYGVEVDLDKFNKDDIVYLVDFSFKRPVLIDVAERVKSLWVLDHHKTAYNDLAGIDSSFGPGNIFVYFDMSLSGAQLAYNYLKYGNPLVNESGGYPTLVGYVADRDLWEFKLLQSKEISMYIRSFAYEFNEWKSVEYNLNYYFDSCVLQGKAILRYQEQQIEQAVSHAVDMLIAIPEKGTYIVPAVNTTVNFSEVAGELAESRLLGIAWFQRSDGKFQYSLRSRNEGADVSEIAKAFGGGGHRNAAGFESDVQVLQWMDK